MAHLQSCSWQMYQHSCVYLRPETENSLGKTHFMYGTQMTFIERAAVLSEWALCHAAFENLHTWDKLRWLICRNHTSDLSCPQSAVTVALNMRESLLLLDQSI